MDWISAVEDAYASEGDESAWLERVLRRLDVFDAGLGVVAQVFRLGASGPVLTHAAAVGGDAELLSQVRSISQYMPADVIPALAHVGRVASLRVALRRLGGRHEQSFIEAFARHGARGADVLYVPMYDGEGELVSIAAARDTVGGPLPDPARVRRIATHVGAAWRLRRRLAAAPSPDAVITPSGAIAHAEGAAIGVREQLAQAVRHRERARSSLRRRDPDGALSLWPGLASGRWSLIDSIERDGRRFVVAHVNDPRAGVASRLARREAQIASLLGLGSSLKEAAYDLGISPSAAAKAASRAREKLGVSSLAELAALVAAVAQSPAPGGPVTLLSSERSSNELAQLTRAERDVALAMARGASNAEIAARRGTSPRTVANLAQRVFRKLDVTSRTELARRLAHD